MTKVLAFITDFNIGGTEKHVVSLVRGLERAGFEPHVACFRRRGQFLEELPGGSFSLREYPIGRLYGPRAWLQQLRLARYLERHRIGLVHTFGFYPNVFAIPAARLARVPAVLASVRDMGDHLTPFQRGVQRLVCRMADVVLTNAEAVRARLIQEGYTERRIAVIHNGVDTSCYAAPGAGAQLRRDLNLPAGAPLVAVLSRLCPMKGLEYFLQAAARVARELPEVRFVLVGDNTIDAGYRGHLAACAHRLGLAGRVVFAGFRRDVPELLSEVTLSVLPSLSEGLSNALLESMAAGVPVLATAVGGNPEAVEDGQSGLLVPPRDSEALAQAMIGLLEKPGLARALGEAGRRRVLDRFSLERMVRDTETVYRSVLSHAAEPAPGRAGRHPEPSGGDKRSLVDRLLDGLEQGGLPQLLRRGLNRLGSPVMEFGSLTFFRRQLGPSQEGPRLRLPLKVRRASLSDLPLVLEGSDPRRRAETLVERLRRGDLCFIALDPEGRPVHTGWATTSRAHVPELDLDVLLRSGEGYLYDGYTPPARRGHGAFGYVVDHIFAELQAQGIGVAYSYVRSDDPEGQRSASRRLSPVGTLFYLRVLGYRPLVFGKRGGAMPVLARGHDHQGRPRSRARSEAA